MKTKSFSSNATTLIGTFGNAAHDAIGAYREGGERLATAMDQRWKAAMKESSSQLSAETRKNANHAHQVFNGYFSKAVAMSADGAKVVVDTMVGAAVSGVERAAAFQEARTQKAA
ncbi:MAG: hypothetical protein ABIR26_07295 [Ramlibacter sp.]